MQCVQQSGVFPKGQNSSKNMKEEEGEAMSIPPSTNGSQTTECSLSTDNQFTA